MKVKDVIAQLQSMDPDRQLEVINSDGQHEERNITNCQVNIPSHVQINPHKIIKTMLDVLQADFSDAGGAMGSDGVGVTFHPPNVIMCDGIKFIVELKKA